VQGIARGEEALRIAEMVDQPYSLVGAYRGLGYVYLRKGDLKEAVSVFERSHRLWRAWNIPTWFFGIAAHLGYAYALSGRLAEGLALLERATEQSISMGDRKAQPFIYLSEGYRLVNRIDDAIRLANQALDFAREHKLRPDEAWALRSLGEIVSRRDPVDAVEAETCYRQALTLAETLGMRPLVAHCHLGLGKLYAHIGKQQQAGEHLATAAVMYSAMDMSCGLEQANAAVSRV